jgi:hypothetical protein
MIINNTPQPEKDKFVVFTLFTKIMDPTSSQTVRAEAENQLN